MTLTAKGFTDTVANEADWATMFELALRGAWNEVVDDSAFTPTVPTGTRTIAIGTGNLFAAGVLVNNSASANVTLPANGNSNSRIDTVILSINWSTDAVSLTSVQGAYAVNPVAPTLTKTAGTLWQVPLCRVLVRPGVTQIATADMFDCRPSQRKIKTFHPTVTATSMGANASPKTVATRNLSDPGWPYKVEVYGSVNFSNVASGYGACSVLLNGATLTGGRAASGNDAPAIIRPEISDPLTGESTITLTIQPQNMTTTLTSVDANTALTIKVVPA